MVTPVLPLFIIIIIIIIIIVRHALGQLLRAVQVCGQQEEHKDCPQDLRSSLERATGDAVHGSDDDRRDRGGSL